MKQNSVNISQCFVQYLILIKRFTPKSPIFYTKICVNNELKNDDAITNRREFVLITVPNMNISSATSATRTSEKFKCRIVPNDRLLVWFVLNRQIITATFVNRIPSIIMTPILVNMTLRVAFVIVPKYLALFQSVDLCFDISNMLSKFMFIFEKQKTKFEGMRIKRACQ